MAKTKPFVLQLIIVGGFLIFLYIFFALATAVYRDYKLEVNIQEFEDEITRLAELANQKPKDVAYFQSNEYKDKYAKESLNLLNPGEKLIIIPQEDTIVKTEVSADRFANADVLDLPNHNQWWEYFFGNTLSISTKKPSPTKNDTLPSLEERIQDEVLFETEG